jgi:hypothetical protein
MSSKPADCFSKARIGSTRITLGMALGFASCDHIQQVGSAMILL